MTREEAADVTEMVVSAWATPVWTADQTAAFVTGCVSLDADDATEAVARLYRQTKFRPAFSELREMAVSVRRERQSRLIDSLPAEPIKPPDWVGRWERARANGDMRVFVEQVRGLTELQHHHPLNRLAYTVPDQPTTDTTTWMPPATP